MKILKKTENRDSGYSTPKELNEAIEGFRRGITRRKFMKRTAISVGAASPLVALAVGGYRSHKYENSMAFTVEQVRQTNAFDFERMNELLPEFGRRAVYQKILPFEEKKLRSDRYPHATDSKQKWHVPDTIKSTAGRWVRILEISHALTEDSKLAKLAREAANGIRFKGEKERGLEPIRCLHANRDVLSAATYYEGDNGTYDPKIGFYNIGSAFAQRFSNKPTEKERIISINSLDVITPLILKASEKTLDTDLARSYFKHVVQHTNAAMNLVREDGSTRDLAKFNVETGEITEGNYYVDRPNSCTGYYHAVAVDWFATMYERTEDERYKEITHKMIAFYVSRLPEDYVPYYDLSYDPNVPNNGMHEDMPRDTAAAARMCETLTKHDWLMPKQDQKSLLYHTLKSIVVNHADTDENSDAIIANMCSNYRTRSYMDSCIVRGLDSFLETIRRIKEKN